MRREIERKEIDLSTKKDDDKFYVDVTIPTYPVDDNIGIYTFYGKDNRKIHIMSHNIEDAKELIATFDPYGSYDYNDYKNYKLECTLKSKAYQIVNVDLRYETAPYFVNNSQYDKLKIWIIHSSTEEEKNLQDIMYERKKGYTYLTTKNINELLPEVRNQNSSFFRKDIYAFKDMVINSYQERLNVKNEYMKLIKENGSIVCIHFDQYNIGKEKLEDIKNTVDKNDRKEFGNLLKKYHKMILYVFEKKTDFAKLSILMADADNLNNASYHRYSDDIMDDSSESTSNYIKLKEILKQNSLRFDDFPIVTIGNKAFKANI